MDLSNAPLTDEQHMQVNILFNVVNDIERVGDHADNIAELSQIAIEERLEFTPDAMMEFDYIFDKTHRVFKTSLESLEKNDYNLAKKRH